MIKTNYTHLISDTILVLLVSLYTYASLSKLLVVEDFRGQLAQSPLIPYDLIFFVAYFVPLAELALVVLLMIDKTRLFALYLSLFVMLGFTVYLVMLISIDETLPCSCGGILGKLSYHAHIIFNGCFVVISVAGIFMQSVMRKTYA